MKKFVVMIAFVLLTALCLASCAPDPREAKYNDALSMIESSNYTDAYALLKELGDYKDAESHLAKFICFPTKITYDFYDRAGVMTTTLGKYNLPATTVSEADIGKKEGEYTYDDKGNLTRQAMTSGDVHSYFDYIYDENNRRIKAEYYEEGVLLTVHDFPHNDQGLIAKEVFTSEGVVVYESINTYNESGNLIKVEYVSETRGSWTYIYTYDDKGHITTEKCQSPDGSETYYTYTYTYDESGKRVSADFTEGDNHCTAVFEYNAAGLLTKEEYLFDDGTKDSFTKEYDANGNMVREVWSYSDGEVETADYEYTLTYITGDIPEETMTWVINLFDIN